jgi:hypothetical protein
MSCGDSLESIVDEKIKARRVQFKSLGINKEGVIDLQYSQVYAVNLNRWLIKCEIIKNYFEGKVAS